MEQALCTLPGHLSLPPFMHVFTFLILCCDVRYDFHVKTMFGSFLLLFACWEFMFFFMLFVFNYVYWCPTRFPFEMTFVSFYSNTTGVTSGSWTVNPSGAPEFTPGFNRVRVVRSLGFCVVFSGSLFIPLFIHCVVCLSSIYGFWLPRCYLQTLFIYTFTQL